MPQQKNKKADLSSSLGSFMKSVEENIPVETPKETPHKEVQESRVEVPEVPATPTKMGRPLKSTTLVCDKMKSFRFDKETCRSLEAIRFYEGISMQDFVYVAVNKLLREYNSDTGGKNVARFIKERIKELFDRDLDKD